LYVELGWEVVPWAGAYRILRSTDGEYYFEIARVGGSVTSYDDSPSYANLYYYSIASETMTGTIGEASEPVQVQYTANLVAPTGVIAENLGTSIKISWDLQESADGYKIYRARSESDSFEYLDSTLETFYIDIPSTGGSYYYKIRAFDFLGHQSPLSNSAYVHFDDRPLPPYNVVVVDSFYKVYLWWESIETEAEYAIYRSTSMESDYAYIQTVDELSAFDWPPSAGSYFYEIRTIVDYDTSDYSEFRHVAFSGILQPPSDLTAIDAGTHIHIAWTAPEGGSYYEVYRSDSIDDGYVRIMTVYENSADNAPEAGGTYYFKIKAFTQGSLPSQFSDSVEVEFEP
jgi:fibronectin type 3 domain-containing protein